MFRLVVHLLLLVRIRTLANVYMLISAKLSCVDQLKLGERDRYWICMMEL
jgi:hypothetical protein